MNIFATDKMALTILENAPALIRSKRILLNFLQKMHKSASVTVEQMGGSYPAFFKSGDFQSLPLPVFEVYNLPLLRPTVGMREYNEREIMEAKKLDETLNMLYPSDGLKYSNVGTLCGSTIGYIPKINKQIRAVISHYGADISKWNDNTL